MSDNYGSGPGGMTASTDPPGGRATDAFGTSDMAAALTDAQGDNQNGVHGDNENGAQGEAGAAATDGKDPAKFGWNDPVAHDYAALTRESAVQWDGNARVYEWDGEAGDVGPEFPELEEELFGSVEAGDRDSHGIDFAAIADIKVTQEGPERVTPITEFKDAGLHPTMLRSVELAGYKVPTPIQKYCLPAIHLGYDVIAIAQTGSGKTAAYLIPILNKLMGKAKKLAAPRPNPATYRPGFDAPVRAEPLVVIVCPTRELAVQIFHDARKFCYRTMLRPCVVYGGGPLRDQIDQLSKGCDVLIASPGRLIDMMDRPHVLTLRRVKYMVIDEADEMLHSDWEDEFNKILGGGEQEEGNIKYMLFSATFPKKVRDLAKTHLADNHVRFRVGRAGSTHANIMQKVVWVDSHQKRQALWDLLHATPPARTIIFVNSKRAADEVDDFLFNKGLPSTSMHADRTQREREDAMRAFRSGACPILITTGVTARGIDVRNVLHVINYDLPSIDYGGIEEYTHRIGRTGRIGHKGLATSFYNERDEPLASVLTRTLLETNQEVPDFLQQYVPEGEAREHLKFEADSDWDENEAAGGGNDWGVGGDAGGGWGGNAEQSGGGGGGGGGWGAPAADAPAADTTAADAPAADTGGNGWGGGGVDTNW